MAIVDPRFDLARQQAYQATPRVTTLNQALQIGQAPRAVDPTALAQLELDQLARTRFSDTARQREAMRIAAGERADRGGWAGFIQDVMDFAPVKYGILKPLEVLDTPRRALISGIREAADFFDSDPNTRASWGDFASQARDVTYGFGTAFPDITGNKWLDRVIGFVGDVALDPLTYVTTGANVAARKGVFAAGREGRIAAATKVLQITGDADKAATVAKEGLSAARRVLTKAEQKLLGLEDSGLYLFGKHLPAVRIAGTANLGDGAERLFSRLRIAATSTRPGGWMQQMTMGKWLPEERLKLLRGEMPSEKVAETLIAIGAQDAYRATATSAMRDVTRIFKQAAAESGMESNDQIRTRLYRLLEDPTLLASATDAERRAAATWKKAFDSLWDQLDASIRVIDDAPEAGFGRVQRYFPHVLTEDARQLLSGEGSRAKRLAELFGEDAMGPTTFFNPRSLKAGDDFFGYKLTDADLTVERLNQIARQYGKLEFDFFETDLGKVARGYAAVWSDQMGRMGVASHLVENKVIDRVGQKLVHDPSQLKNAQRVVAEAMASHDQKFGEVVAAVREASQAIVQFSDAIDQRILEATKAAAVTPASGRAAAEAGKALVAARQRFAELSSELETLKGKIASFGGSDAYLAWFDGSIEAAQANLKRAEAEVDRLVEFESLAPVELANAKKAAKRAEKEFKAASKQAEMQAARVRLLLEYHDWVGRSYDALVEGRFDDVSAMVFEDGPSSFMLTEMFNFDQLPPSRQEKLLATYAKGSGSLSDWLVGAKDLDPEVSAILRSITKDQLKKTTHAQIVQMFDNAVAGTATHAEAQKAAALVVARTLKQFGSVENIPQLFRPFYDAAVEDVKRLGDLVRFEEIASRAGRANPVRVEALASKYGDLFYQMEGDLDEYRLLVGREKVLRDRLAMKADWLDRADVKMVDNLVGKDSLYERPLDERDWLTEFDELREIADRKSVLERRVYKVGRQAEDGSRAKVLDSAARIQQLEAELEPLQRRLQAAKTRKTERLIEKQIDSIMAEIGNAANTNQLAEAQLVDITFLDLLTDDKVLENAYRRADRAARSYDASIANDAMRTRKEVPINATRAQKQANKVVGGTRPQGDRLEWMKVSGKSIADHRDEIMFRLEEFFLVAETARRFSVLTEKFALVGLKPTDQMLTDVMQAVRRTRGSRAWIGVSAIADGMLSEFNVLRSALPLSEMRGDEIPAALSKLVSDLYEKIGVKDATRVLGPASKWENRPRLLLERLNKLQNAATRGRTGAEREAARADLKALVKDEIRPWIEQTHPMSTGKWSRQRFRQLLEAAARETDVTSISSAERRLDEIAQVIRTKVQVGHAYRNMYGQLGDPDWSASVAFSRGQGKARMVMRQDTPSVGLVAREAALKRIENLSEMLRKSVEIDLGDAPARWAGMADDIQVRAADANARIKKAQAYLNMLDGQIAKLKSEPMAPKAFRDDGMYSFMHVLATLDPTKMDEAAWRHIGVNVPLDQSSVSEVEKLIADTAAARAAGQQVDVFYSTTRSTVVDGNGRVVAQPSWPMPLDTVDQLVPGDVVYVAATRQSIDSLTSGITVRGVLPDKQMWESLFIGQGKVQPLTSYNASRKLAKVQQEYNDLLERIERVSDGGRKTRMSRSEKKNLAVLKEQARVKRAEIVDLGRQVDANKGPNAQRAAFAWLSEAYDSIKRAAPKSEREKPWEQRWFQGQLDGVASVEADQALIDARRAALAAAHADSESGKFMRRVAELELRRGEAASRVSGIFADMEEIDKIAETMQAEVADLYEKAAKARGSRYDTPERWQEKLAREFEALEPQRMPFDAAGPLPSSGFVSERSGRLVSDLRQEIADRRAAVGSSRGEPVELLPSAIPTRFAAVDEARAALGEADINKSLADQAVRDAEKAVKDAPENIKAAKAALEAKRKETERQLALLVGVRDEYLKPMQGIVARVKDLPDEIAAAEAALIKAKEMFDQAAAAFADDLYASKALVEAAQLQRVVADDFLSEFVVSRARRVAGGERLSAAQQKKLTAAIEKGQAAEKRLAAGTKTASKGKGKAAKSVTVPLTEAEKTSLEKAVKAGNEAARKLAVANASDMEAANLVRLLEDVARNINAAAPSGTRSQAQEAFGRLVNVAFNAEVEWITSGKTLRAAEEALYDAQYLATKVVPDIRDGWTRLEKWGLPSYQGSPELVQMFDNISRVEIPAVARELSQFLGGYTRFFKAWAVATPGFHIRNALSNTFSVFSAGADVSNMARGVKLYEGWLSAMKRGIEEERAWIAALPEAERARVVLAKRMMDAAGAGMGVSALDELAATGGRKWATDNWYLRANRAFGERVEGSARFMLAYDSVAKGMDLQAGSARVKRYLFDYGDRSKLDESLGVVIPFWTWMSRNLPLQIVNRWTNPRAYLTYNKLMNSIREDEEGAVTPSWLREQGAVSLGGGMFLNPDLPQTRIGETLAMAGDPKRLLSMVNPALRLPIELTGGRQLYNDVPFSDRPQQVTGGPLSSILTPLLALAGQTQTVGPQGVTDGSGRMILQPGETATNATANYALMNAIPFLSLTERLLPNTDQYEQRQGQSWLNFLGVPLRNVTPAMQEAEIERRKRQIAGMAAAAQRLGYTP